MSEKRDNILERAIAVVSPAWAFRRAAWRLAMRSYDAGDSGRLNGNWTAVNAAAEVTDSAYRSTVRARARDLERNSDIMESLIRPFTRNVVGSGFRLQSYPRKAGGEIDEALADRIETLWKAWQKPYNCDVIGQQSFAEMCRMIVRRMLVDGGVLVVKNYTSGTQLLPFQLQVREVDDLDMSVGFRSGSGNNIVGGIELESGTNRPLAYYLKGASPDGFTTGEVTRIEANRVMFLYNKKRPSQVREMSQLASSISRVRDVNEYLEAVSVKERVAACMSAAITSQTPPSTIGRGPSAAAQSQDATSGRYGETLGPGQIYYLQPGEDVKSIVPPSYGSNVREFVSLQQRLAGAGQGLSFEATTRDMSEVNYSSARQARIEDQAEYDVMAQYLVDHLLDPVYQEFVISCVLAGKWDAPGFWSNTATYMDHTFMAPGLVWIDPLKEAKADLEAVNGNMDTLANRLARRGLDWQEVLKQRAREVEAEKGLGISQTPTPVKVHTEVNSA